MPCQPQRYVTVTYSYPLYKIYFADPLDPDPDMLRNLTVDSSIDNGFIAAGVILANVTRLWNSGESYLGIFARWNGSDS